MRHFCTLHGWDSWAPCRRCADWQHQVEEQLQRAVVSSFCGDVSDLEELFTPTVLLSGPATAACDRDELALEIEQRRHSLTRERVTFGPVHRRGRLMRLEWEASARQTGPLALHGVGAVLEPMDLNVSLRAVTFVRFDGLQIASWRGRWDDLALTV
jgi:hypothetical protein